MPKRCAFILTLLTACLLCACQTAPPPFPAAFTDSQQDELTTIYVSVWSEARATRTTHGDISRQEIYDLVADQDTRVRANLDDAQWQMFNNDYRNDWVDKIYRTAHPRSSTTGSGKSPSYRIGTPSPGRPSNSGND